MNFVKWPDVYQPLRRGQIRILRTVFITENDPVFSLETVWLTDDLRIQTVPLRSDPRIQTVPSHQDSHTQGTAFDALSYHWGSREGSPHQLNVGNGCFIEIHDNLHLALPYLVRRASKLPLWIDAVCINQEDKSELASQIKMQSRIYKKAINVWIWLGPVPTGVDDAAARDAIGYISRMDQTITNDVELGRSVFSLRALELPTANSPLLKLIIAILKSTWFTRLWIVQECTLATNPLFLFGNLIIEWHHLGQAYKRLTLPRHLTNKDGHRIGHEISNTIFTPVFHCRDQYWNYPGDGFKHIGIMLPFTIRQGSKHPESKVNALLGFLDENTLSEFTFDGNTSVRDLYTEFFNVMICQSTYRRVLLYTLWFAIESTGKSDKGLPSWCPDFDALYRYQMAAQSLLPDLRAYTLSQKRIYTRRGDTMSKIVVKGFLFDRVHLKGEPMTDFRSTTLAEHCKWWYNAQEWEDKAAQMIVTKGVVESDRYYKVLFDYHIVDFITVVNPIKVVTEHEYLNLKRDLADLAKIVRDFGLARCVDYLERPERAQTDHNDFIRLRRILNNLEEDESAREFRRGLQNRAGYRPAVTEKGSFAFIHGDDVDRGHEIWLVNGAEIFYVLRRKEDETAAQSRTRDHLENFLLPSSSFSSGVRQEQMKSYSLVGDAWINLCMSGIVENMNLKDEEIVLV